MNATSAYLQVGAHHRIPATDTSPHTGAAMNQQLLKAYDRKRRPPKRATLCAVCPKVAFKYRGDAERFLRRGPRFFADFDASRMHVYFCPFGHGFHIGHDRSGRFTEGSEV